MADGDGGTAKEDEGQPGPQALLTVVAASAPLTAHLASGFLGGTLPGAPASPGLSSLTQVLLQPYPWTAMTGWIPLFLELWRQS